MHAVSFLRSAKNSKKNIENIFFQFFHMEIFGQFSSQQLRLSLTEVTALTFFELSKPSLQVPKMLKWLRFCIFLKYYKKKMYF